MSNILPFVDFNLEFLKNNLKITDHDPVIDCALRCHIKIAREDLSGRGIRLQNMIAEKSVLESIHTKYDIYKKYIGDFQSRVIQADKDAIILCLLLWPYLDAARKCGEWVSFSDKKMLEKMEKGQTLIERAISYREKAENLVSPQSFFTGNRYPEALFVAHILCAEELNLKSKSFNQTSIEELEDYECKNISRFERISNNGWNLAKDVSMACQEYRKRLQRRKENLNTHNPIKPHKPGAPHLRLVSDAQKPGAERADFFLYRLNKLFPPASNERDKVISYIYERYSQEIGEDAYIQDGTHIFDEVEQTWLFRYKMLSTYAPEFIGNDTQKREILEVGLALHGFIEDFYEHPKPDVPMQLLENVGSMMSLSYRLERGEDNLPQTPLFMSANFFCHISIAEKIKNFREDTHLLTYHDISQILSDWKRVIDPQKKFGQHIARSIIQLKEDYNHPTSDIHIMTPPPPSP